MPDDLEYAGEMPHRRCLTANWVEDRGDAAGSITRLSADTPVDPLEAARCRPSEPGDRVRNQRRLLVSRVSGLDRQTGSGRCNAQRCDAIRCAMGCDATTSVRRLSSRGEMVFEASGGRVAAGGNLGKGCSTGWLAGWLAGCRWQSVAGPDTRVLRSSGVCGTESPLAMLLAPAL